jgi:phospholipid-binding lipoprotein MlaA
MKKTFIAQIGIAYIITFSSFLAMAEENAVDEYADGPDYDNETQVQAWDPLEPVNRAFFHFNDKFYFWILKPVSTGYAKIVPEQARVGVKNFFANVGTPARAVNCLLQGDWRDSIVEVERFAINSTVGILGFDDAAAERFGIRQENEDFGQTLGSYGIGSGLYINWPILGPSNLRDSIGMVGDSFLNPWNYAIDSTGTRVLIRAEQTVNAASLRLGEYEEFKESAIDPYISLRDAYEQMRQRKIEE